MNGDLKSDDKNFSTTLTYGERYEISAKVKIGEKEQSVTPLTWNEPKQTVEPVVPDYTFLVVKAGEKNNGDTATVSFSVTPEKDIGNLEYQVSAWTVNGDLKSDDTNFSTTLTYGEKYSVSATVTVDGHKQKVIPLTWNEPKQTVEPVVPEYTFQVKKDRETKNGDDANVVFSVAPEKDIGNLEYKVSSWTLDGKPQSDDQLFVTTLSYKEKYEISVTVTIGDKKQNVIPYKWDQSELENETPIIVPETEVTFQVVKTNETKNSDNATASVSFSVKPEIEIENLEYQVSAWTVNGDLKSDDTHFSTTLTYGTEYSISAKVKIGEKEQSVTPLIWNEPKPVPDYTFFVVKIVETKNSDNATATVSFSVMPEKDIENLKYQVSAWTVNGDLKSDNENFSTTLTYGERYEISATVTVDGHNQKVIPLTWNQPKPVVPNYTFQVVKTGETKNSDNATATVSFSVKPERNIGNLEYQVSAWTVNGTRLSDDTNFSTTFTYGERYEISATVKVGEKEQKVIPLIWNEPKPVPEYTFLVVKADETQNSDNVTATVSFSVTPEKDIENLKYQVNAWTVNGDLKSDDTNFSTTLIYGKRYEISATVTVDGREQKVIPLIWNESVVVPEYTFQVEKADETKNDSATATLLFRVKPETGFKEKYEVSGWTVNGKLLSNDSSFSTTLPYGKRHEISATVTVNGKKQEVIPFIWNESPPDIDLPAYTFHVTKDKEIENGDTATVTVSVKPASEMDKEYQVSKWTVNEKLLSNSRSKTITVKLSYGKSYEISAMVTVDGNEQIVVPFKWNGSKPPPENCTFLVETAQQMDNGENGTATVLFRVKPEEENENLVYQVKGWTLNGELQTDDQFFVTDLTYGQDYLISATVTINGKEQNVIPFKWNQPPPEKGPIDPDPAFTFQVIKDSETDNGDTATVMFGVKPEDNETPKYQVKEWTVNGESRFDGKYFVADLTYGKEYEISTTVTIDGKKQKVIPFKWNQPKPVKAKDPEKKDPEVKDPEVKDPEVKDPEKKDPEVKDPVKPIVKDNPGEEIPGYKFQVKIESETDNGDDASVVFGVKPDSSSEGVAYVVSSWSINRISQPDSKSQSFSTKLSYTRRYEISAVVTVDGKEQEVLPFQWDSAVEPVWMIRSVGNNDREYQVLCTNSSNTHYRVVNWYMPEFHDEKGKDISNAFTSSTPVTIDYKKARYEWKQEHIGEYVMTLKADVEYTPSRPGRKAKVVQVQNSFVMINGSPLNALITGKQMLAKKSIYHCLTVLKTFDGNAANSALGSGTAFAISNKMLLTNYHVAVGSLPGHEGPRYEVDQTKPLVLTNETDRFYAKVIAFDRDSDIALLELCDKDGGETDEKLPAFLLLSDDAPRVEARVFSAGYPEGTTRVGEPVFVEGKIENVKENGGEVISQFSNRNPGYSGGPLIYLDEDNTVVGINTALRPAADSNEARGATSALEIKKKFRAKLTENSPSEK